MTAKKSIPLITVLLAEGKITTANLIEACNLQNTSSLTNPPPVSDTVIHQQALTLEQDYNKSKGVPPTATTNQVNIDREICITSYNKNAAFIQGVARDAAIAAGNRSAGLLIVQHCGFKVKRDKSPTIRKFRVTLSEVGAVDITTKSVAAKAGYIRQYGITPTKGIPPTVLAENCHSCEINVHITNLTSGTIYGFREASVLPTKRTKASGTATSISTATTVVQKTATPTVATKSHRVSYTDGAELYNWSDWIYIVIQ